MKAQASQTPLIIHRKPLPAGLYIVATPIGNLGDITLRALETLHSAELIACEDTRMTGRLLRHFGIEGQMESYHDHNAHLKRPQLIAAAQGKPVALVSDAGTPLISDPGYKLVRGAIEAGVTVQAIPGASSIMAALCVAGQPTDRFLFEGFLPPSENQQRNVLKELSRVRTTLVFFESAKRLRDTLPVMAEILGPREACIARELTKLYEEAVHGTLPELAAHYAALPEPRGEIVIVVGPPSEELMQPSEDDMDSALRNAMTRQSLKDAVAEVCALLGAPKSKVYARALKIKEEQ